MRKPSITIAGAGLVGALLATLLAQRGFKVTVLERRPDPRKFGFLGGRSINLALAERGWHGLRLAGMQKRMEPIAVMMRGRMVHDLDGRTNLQLYGRDDSEVIWSVSRGTLNTSLIDAAEAAGASIQFDRGLSGVDWLDMSFEFRDRENNAHLHKAEVVIGADGAGSALRAAMARTLDLGERFEPLRHGYKELEIPALQDFPEGSLPANLVEAAARGDRFAMEPNALHIWPRGDYMCIALPNAEGSFTVTLFLPNDGEPSLTSVASADAAEAFFRRDFPDALPLIPELRKDYVGNPTGMLGTQYLDLWHLDGRALLVGDASHAILPFHGQGMNSGFEDAVELADLLESNPGDTGSVFAEFQRRRKPNADAIAAMAIENYVEMRDRVDDADYLLMRELDRLLADRHPGRWVPRYGMVTFTRIPYSTAFERGATQSAWLREWVTDKSRIDQIDLAALDSHIRNNLQPLPADA